MSSAYHSLESAPDNSAPADRTGATRSAARDPSSVGLRVATSGTLFGVVAVTAIAALFTPPAVTTSESPAAGVPDTPAAPAPGERMAGAPVKIIGATPRSENCEGQVWPYIESRCLLRTAAKPRAAETTGAAPIAAAATPGVMDAKAEPRTATARLRLPPRLASATDAWAGDSVERPTEAKPRRRSGRRAYRNYRWGGRHAFPFRF
jgi:hypothetical protein